MGGDPEASFVHYILHKFHWKPHEFFDLSPNEQAFIIASIQVRSENEKKANSELMQKAKQAQHH